MLTRTPLELDERAFKKLNKLLAKTHEQALAIAAESARAATRADGRSSRPRSAILHFKRAARRQTRAPPRGGARGPASRALTWRLTVLARVVLPA